MTAGAAERVPARSRALAELPADPLDLVPRDAVVAVAMSGGVDSSVAAARCVERGLETVGITLAMWPRDRTIDRDRGCCGVDAVSDARRVAATLGIRHYAWNLEQQFHDSVITDFEDEYARGRTPNPCIRCNDRIKFGTLLQRALAVGATHVATGHYARIGRRGDAFSLHRGVDPGKDQAYTLFSLGHTRLAQAVFPIGAMASKHEVRRLADRFGLGTANKAESQELCFVEGDLAIELAARLRGRFSPGPIRDAAGTEIGRHRGLPFYTVGQRRGLGLHPDRSDAAPLHVLRIDAARNELVVGPRRELSSRRVDAQECNWVVAAPEPGTACAAQVRAHGEAHDAVVVCVDESTVHVRFVEAVSQVAPGQALVLYAGDEVLGGGTVVRTG